MKTIYTFVFAGLFYISSWGQVDTTYIYGPRFGDSNVDIRIYINENNYYYLQPGETFSFRAVDGVPTNTYSSMAGFNTSQYTQGHMRRQTSATTSQFVMNYRLLFPKSYNESYEQGYPLILMLHGYGERGNCWAQNCYWATRSWSPLTNNPPAPPNNGRLLNNDHNLLHGGRQHLEAVNLANGRLPDDPTLQPRAFPGFVLFPQNVNGWGSGMPGNAYDVIRLVRLMIKNYNIDPNRIYIHGVSEGGAAVYHVVRRAPWLFSAVMTMSAVNDGGIIYNNLQSEIITLPIRTFQGGKDVDPTPGETKGYVTNFKNAGLDVKYYLYPHLGHGTWNVAYAEPDFFSWMLGKNKANPHLKYGVNYICGTSGAGVEMIFAKGFFAYEWERDGAIISGATSHTYTATVPGTYRGRFSRVANPGPDDWNRWSDPIVIQEKTLPPISTSADYTTIFPNVNNDNAVTLRAEDSGLGYHWFKNLNQINFTNSSQDDTINHFTVTNTAFGDGDYVVKSVEGTCEGLASEPIYVRYATTETLAAPSAFTGAATSASSVFLNWTDNTSNEKGFEIWRRKGASGKFDFVALTQFNAVSYEDTGLEPAAEYHYKIRTVSNTSRSSYAPGNDPSTNVVVTTLADNTPPGAPQNLSVTGNTVNSITLSWQAASDNTGIRQYIITYGSNTAYTVSDVTQFTITGLPMNTSYTITATAQDLAGHISAASNQVTGTTYVNGLDYEHSTGAWTTLTDIDWSFIEYAGKVNNFTLAPRTQEDFFNFRFDGYLYIPDTRNYQFQLISNDGSMLFLDGFNPTDPTQYRIINNDLQHGNVAVNSEEIPLSLGPHRIVVTYFENSGSQSLSVLYRRRDDSGTGWAPDWTPIPNEMLTSGSYVPPSSLPAPSGLTATANGMTQVNLAWAYGGPATDQFEIYRSTSTNGTYEILGRVSTASYIDTGLSPATTYYYKLKSVNTNGSSSPFSNIASASTAADTEAPSIPTGLQALSINSTSVSFTWSVSTDNTGITGYYIYRNGTLLGSSDTPGYMADGLLPNTTYSFTVKAYDASNNLSAASAPLAVTTSIGSTVCQFIIEASDVCGDPQVFIHVSQTQAGATYVAAIAGVNVSESVMSTGQDLVLQVSAEHLQEGNNTLTVTADRPCGSDPTSKEIVVNYTSAPVTLVEENILSVCEGSSVTLGASGAPAGGLYQWYDSEGNLVAESSDGVYITQPVHSFSNFQVVAVSANGCEGNLVDIQITPESVPDPVITVVENSYLVLNTPVTNDISIHWHKNGQSFQESDTSMVLSGAGEYYVILSLNGCTKFSESVLINEVGQVITSLQPEVKGQSAYYTYPNPVHSEFYIHIASATTEPLDITVTDMTGKIFYAGEIKPQSTGVYRLNAPEHMTSGSYIITFVQGDTQVRRRIAVVR